MKHFFTLTSIALMVLFYIGCSSDVEQDQLNNPTQIDPTDLFIGAPLKDGVILKNMYEDEVRSLIDKTSVQIVTVLEGTGRVTLEARYRGVRDFGLGFPVYECELQDNAAEAIGGIAQGMSGSPVGPPGRVMGALAYGNAFSKSPTRFWVTSIDAMEASIVRQTFGDLLDGDRAPAAPSIGIHTDFTPVKTPLMITGIQSHRLEQLTSYLKGERFQYLELFSSVAGSPAAPPADTSSLEAGDMIGVAVATGDVVNAIGYGTVTQVYDDDTFVAFGHPMNGDGKASLPVYRAVVNGIIPNLQASYKSTYAYGNPIGTITKDLTPAIVGKLGSPPAMIPVKVAYQVSDGGVIQKHHQVAYGQEVFIPVIAAITMDSIRQELSPGTIDVTVTLRFKETETIYTESFRSASSNPFIDLLFNVDRIVASFDDIFSNSASKTTLTEVSIEITDKPQIMLAAIHELVVPEEIVPGESATFKVVLLPHWTATNGSRKIEKEVTLDIPDNFTKGRANLSVKSEDPFDNLFFDFSFDENDEEETPLPENLDELIKQMEDGQTDLGIITIILTPNDAGLDFSILEDPFSFDNDDLSEDNQIPPIETKIVIDGFIITGSMEKPVNVIGKESLE
ncbi:hypothetical protein F4212_06710 [Candidatus Poribacteria bacterium]|nr:hypothetical protein [Candidatus Poribacteria bacterium]